MYYGVVAFDLGLGGPALGGAIQVSRSTDGGQTFARPVVVERSTSGTIFEDKPERQKWNRAQVMQMLSRNGLPEFVSTAR